MDIRIENFGSAFGKKAGLHTISNGVLTAGITDFGAALVSLRTEDGRGLVLGYDSAEGYALGSSSLGATVGRYAGRIGGAGFSLGGIEYSLPKNDGENHLHGCFGRRFFKAGAEGDSIVMTLVSPDGEEGFPGELTLKVRYSLEDNALRIAYEASADRDTFVNITNHSYFNLEGGGSVGGHILKVHSDRYAEVGAGLIPTGRLLPVSGTPFDLTEGKPLSETINDPALAGTRGYDHSFILPGEGLRTAAELFSPKAGLRLVCRTTQPTVHVYTAGSLDMDSAPCLRGGAKPLRNGAVCLETQRLPDSPNKPCFPSALLRAGETYSELTEYAVY